VNFDDIRKLSITALFSDDVLFEQIVLKGGNAMSLIYHISPRVSLDLDFSMEADFDNLEEIQARIEHVLADRFNSVGLIPFEIELTPEPSVQGENPPWWGRLSIAAKLADEKRHRSFGSCLSSGGLTEIDWCSAASRPGMRATRAGSRARRHP
jgi:hypothetical protein